MSPEVQPLGDQAHDHVGGVAGANGGERHWADVAVAAPKLNLLRIEEELSAAHLHLSLAYIENLPWINVVKRYDRPHTLFYCDPPYCQTAGYGVEFGFEHYENMAQYMREIDGTMIVSINDHPDIRKVFAEFPMTTVAINYTVGGGQNAQSAKELIIGNRREGWPAAKSMTETIGLNLDF